MRESCVGREERTWSFNSVGRVDRHGAELIVVLDIASI